MYFLSRSHKCNNYRPDTIHSKASEIFQNVIFRNFLSSFRTNLNSILLNARNCLMSEILFCKLELIKNATVFVN